MTEIDWRSLASETTFEIYNLIDGKRRTVSGETQIEKCSPRDGTLLYRIGEGTVSDVHAAVMSATRSYDDRIWSGLPLHERQAALRKLADLIDINQKTLALYECLDAGKPISKALGDVAIASSYFREAADGAAKLFSNFAANGTYSVYQLRKPVGVVGAITAWNYPLVIAALKASAALIMGNSLVLKPSEITSLSAGHLATLALEAGIPPGVFNVVHGSGEVVGAALARHNGVGLLSFTGSSITGKQIQSAAGESNMKRLLLECGGKNPFLIFDDCPDNLDLLASEIADSAFNNQGQNCMATSRLLLQSGVRDKLLPKVIEQVSRFIPRDPFDPSSTYGPLISEDHMNKVLDSIESGEKDGANLLTGGSRVHVDVGNAANGFFIEPTVFDNVNPQQRIAQEEIFGPVLSVFTFESEEDAIELANNTAYGLAAFVATENMGRVHRLTHELNSGSVMFIGTSTPDGARGRDIGKEGHRESGFGLEGGLFGLESYSVCTTVHQWA